MARGHQEEGVTPVTGSLAPLARGRRPMKPATVPVRRVPVSLATSPVWCQFLWPPVPSGAGCGCHLFHRAGVIRYQSRQGGGPVSSGTSCTGCWLRPSPASPGWCCVLPIASGGAGFVGHQLRRAGVFCYRFRREAVSSGAGSSADSFVGLVSPGTSFIRCQFPRAGVFSGQFHRGQVGSWQVRLDPDWTLVHRHLKRGDGKG